MHTCTTLALTKSVFLCLNILVSNNCSLYHGYLRLFEMEKNTRNTFRAYSVMSHRKTENFGEMRWLQISEKFGIVLYFTFFK
jgi:hypothetical protein